MNYVLVKGPKGLHRVGISMVKRPNDETEKKWFDIFKAAKFQLTANKKRSTFFRKTNSNEKSDVRLDVAF